MVLATERTPSVAANWNARLCRAFQDIFVLETLQQGRQTVIQAHSRDKRAFWRTSAQERVLNRGNLRLAMPGRDDLEMLRLGCWTLLFLRAVFPEWLHLEEWIHESSAGVVTRPCPVETRLNGYVLSCQFIVASSLLEYRISRPD